MTDTQTAPGLLGGLMGPITVDTNVGLATNDLVRIGATLFVSLSLVFLAYFAIKKFMQ
jgi:hypothetical protein